MTWIVLTLAVAIVSAVVPLFSTELFIVGLMSQRPGLAWWLVGVAAATGQVTGKLLYYYAGRGKLTPPRRLRFAVGKRGGGRWRRWLAAFRRSCRNRPVWSAWVMLLSAIVGLPPFAATSVAAGVGKVPIGRFIGLSLLGRSVRFGAVAALPGVVTAWLF